MFQIQLKFNATRTDLCRIVEQMVHVKTQLLKQLCQQVTVGACPQAVRIVAHFFHVENHALASFGPRYFVRLMSTHKNQTQYSSKITARLRQHSPFSPPTTTKTCKSITLYTNVFKNEKIKHRKCGILQKCLRCLCTRGRMEENTF